MENNTGEIKMSTLTVEKKKRGNPNFTKAKSYSEVREIVKHMQFKNLREYRAYVEQYKPEGFPLSPYATYEQRGEWISARHFLGKTDIAPSRDVIVPEDKGISKPFNYIGLKSIIKQILHIK